MTLARLTRLDRTDPVAALRRARTEILSESVRTKILAMGRTAIEPLFAVVADASLGSDHEGICWPRQHAVEMLLEVGGAFVVRRLLRTVAPAERYYASVYIADIGHAVIAPALDALADVEARSLACQVLLALEVEDDRLFPTLREVFVEDPVQTAWMVEKLDDPRMAPAIEKVLEDFDWCAEKASVEGGFGFLVDLLDRFGGDVRKQRARLPDLYVMERLANAVSGTDGDARQFIDSLGPGVAYRFEKWASPLLRLAPRQPELGAAWRMSALIARMAASPQPDYTSVVRPFASVLPIGPSFAESLGKRTSPFVDSRLIEKINERQIRSKRSGISYVDTAAFRLRWQHPWKKGTFELTMDIPHLGVRGANVALVAEIWGQPHGVTIELEKRTLGLMCGCALPLRLLKRTMTQTTAAEAHLIALCAEALSLFFAKHGTVFAPGFAARETFLCSPDAVEVSITFPRIAIAESTV